MRLTALIAPSFYSTYNAIKKHLYTHYWEAGGRGSTKSSFISVVIILLLLQNPDCHAVVMRKVGDTVKKSVYPQIKWAIAKLGLTKVFIFRKSPMEIEYKPTGQKIIFTGVDDPEKTKSIKTDFGYIGIAWFEELNQFHGEDEIRTVNLSLMRGGEKYWYFYSYNPPPSIDNWVNDSALLDVPNRLVHHSDYRSVPKEWLGEAFFLEAELLKSKNETAYRHAFLGEITGTGGAVFENVEDMVMSDEFIASFDKLYYGLDFGFAVDPAAFISMHYDSKKEILYIFAEVYGPKMSNRKLAVFIKESGANRTTADSAEPKSIAELRNDYNLKVYPAKKGKDSVEYGIRWLQERAKIYIDKRRCPNTYLEFAKYEYEQDRQGKFISAYPDKNNHSIDAVRYAMESTMKTSGMKVMK